MGLSSSTPGPLPAGVAVFNKMKRSSAGWGVGDGEKNIYKERNRCEKKLVTE